jgi:hypothetical protein
MNKPVKYVGAMAALLTLGVSTAVSAEGLYLGGAAMQSRFDADEFEVEDIDEEDTGWKAIVGFQPLPHFALEGAFSQFGEAQAPAVAVGGPFEAKAEALSVFGVGILPVGPVDLFLKVGAARISAEGNVGAVLFEEDETELAYGAGVQFNFGRLGLRGEYEKFDTDVIGDLDVISLGVVFHFGTGS